MKMLNIMPMEAQDGYYELEVTKDGVVIPIERPIVHDSPLSNRSDGVWTDFKNDTTDNNYIQYNQHDLKRVDSKDGTIIFVNKDGYTLTYKKTLIYSMDTRLLF